MRQLIVVVSGCFVALLTASCAPVGSGEASCAELQTAMARCYPELDGTATCTSELLARYEGVDLESMDCTDLGEAGKADLWGDDGSINWPNGGVGDPTDDDFEIVGIVMGYQSQIPQDAMQEIQSRTHDDLLASAMSTAWEQATDDELGLGVRDMVVEHTQGIVPVSFETFLSLFPPDLWGPSLDHYVDGELRVYERDEQGRVVRQLERMVLNQMPYDADILNLPCLNGDMTKVEVIVYDEDSAVVYWRVMYSANGTTESDIGSVAFERFDNGAEEHTLVTFHSAHRLNTFGLHIPNDMLMVPVVGIGPFFEDHIDHYRELVTNVTCQDGMDSDGDELHDCDDPDCDAYCW